MRGLLRLWIVVAAVAVAVLMVHDYIDQSRAWQKLDLSTINYCTQQQISAPTHPDSSACIHQMGADKTLFEHEKTSPAAFWAQEFAIWAAVVVAATILLIIGLYIIRWIIRGFTGQSGVGVEEWWGRTFEARGSINIRSIPGDLDDLTALRRLPTEDVAELFRSEGVHDHPSVRGLLANFELRRRESWTARAALVVSILALIVASLRS